MTAIVSDFFIPIYEYRENIVLEKRLRYHIDTTIENWCPRLTITRKWYDYVNTVRTVSSIRIHKPEHDYKYHFPPTVLYVKQFWPAPVETPCSCPLCQMIGHTAECIIIVTSRLSCPVYTDGTRSTERKQAVTVMTDAHSCRVCFKSHRKCQSPFFGVFSFASSFERRPLLYVRYKRAKHRTSRFDQRVSADEWRKRRRGGEVWGRGRGEWRVMWEREM